MKTNYSVNLLNITHSVVRRSYDGQLGSKRHRTTVVRRYRKNVTARCHCSFCACASGFPAKIASDTILALDLTQLTRVSTMAAKTPSESTSEQTGEGSMPLSHNVPPPLSFEKSKLDWLLAINEQCFEAELKTVVSNSAHLPTFMFHST